MPLPRLLRAFARSPRVARPTRRLRLEALEDRLTPSGGLLDPTFGSGGIATTASVPIPDAVAVQPDGRILTVSSASGNNTDFALARYNDNGSLDTSFGNGGLVTTNFKGYQDLASAVSVQPGTGGKILVAGQAVVSPNSQADFAVARYNANGTLDTTFGGGRKPTGKVTLDFSRAYDRVQSLAVLPDGKFVLGGLTGANLALARFNADGSLDTSFGSGGKVVGPATSYGPSGHLRAVGVAVDGAGRVVVTSATPVISNPKGGDSDVLVARYLTTGQPDPTFGAGGIVRTDVAPGLLDGASSVVVQPDGRILVGGAALYETTFNGQVVYPRQFALVRYNPDGSLDGGFGTGGVVTAVPDLSRQSAGQIVGVAVRVDGSILAGGKLNYPGERGIALMRFDAAGIRDLSFGTPGVGGIVTQVPGFDIFINDMAMQPDGRVILGGTFNISDALLARYLTSAPQVTSFTASPNPAPAGSSVTLAASVAAGNPGTPGAVTQVAFYADSNNDGVLDPATDALLGYATYDAGSGQWRLTITTAGWAPGSHRLFARAQDGYGAFGDPVAIDLEVL